MQSVDGGEREKERLRRERERGREREICVICQKDVTVSQRAVTLKEFLVQILAHRRDTKTV